ncbi:MAG: OmpA family protein [Pseudomonadota bacterium]
MKKIVAAAAVLLLVAGCGSDKSKAGVTVNATVDTNRSAAMGDTLAFMPQDVYEQADGVSINAKRVLYFGFDQATVSKDDLETLEVHADYLKSHPNLKLRIEGHTDERGSPEYNIGLGERRAKAVTYALHTMGVPYAQMEVVSYGKQKLADARDVEDAHAKNRRVVMIYENETAVNSSLYDVE